MTAYRKMIYITLLALLASGCYSSKSFVRFEVLQPASLTYPDSVKHIGFINRAPLSGDSFNESNVKNIDYSALQILDSIVCNNLIKGFLEARENFDLPYFENIQLLEARRIDTSKRSEAANLNLRNNVFEDYGLDALVSMEYYDIGLRSSYPYYDLTVMDNVQDYELVSIILWRVYLRGVNKPFNEYLAQDTLFYQNLSTYTREQQLNGPEIIRDGMRVVGYRYGSKHIPAWGEVARIVFRGGDAMLKKAASFTDKGEWENAAILWKELQNNIKPKIAAMANHNLAVHYELQDDLDTAHAYAAKALELWDNSSIASYEKALSVRLKNKDAILKQVIRQ